VAYVAAAPPPALGRPEAPQAKAPQAEAPQAKAPQGEAPETTRRVDEAAGPATGATTPKRAPPDAPAAKRPRVEPAKRSPSRHRQRPPPPVAAAAHHHGTRRTPAGRSTATAAQQCSSKIGPPTGDPGFRRVGHGEDKVCGTPGCSFPAGHAGLCESEVCDPRERRPRQGRAAPPRQGTLPFAQRKNAQRVK